MTTNIRTNKQLEDDEDEIHTLKEAMKRPDLGKIIVDKERYQFSWEYTSRDFKCIKESEITFCEMEKYIGDKTSTILKHIYSSKDEDKIRTNLINFHCYLNNFKIT
mgnify:CR=1 FL=1